MAYSSVFWFLKVEILFNQKSGFTGPFVTLHIVKFRASIDIRVLCRSLLPNLLVTFKFWSIPLVSHLRLMNFDFSVFPSVFFDAMQTDQQNVNMPWFKKSNHSSKHTGQSQSFLCIVRYGKNELDTNVMIGWMGLG